jgi:hypothetical protein
MILITTYYEDKNIERRQELLDCLTNNIANPIISKIHLICENVMPPIESSDKMVVVLANIRWTFKELIKYANNLGNKEIKIIANTDIYFNHTLAFANLIKFNEVFCLTRWDYVAKENLKFYANFKSQDAWIFRDILPESIGDYFMGIPGCDNRLANELEQNGFHILNPSFSIQAIHLHNTRLRNYNKSVDKVAGPYSYPLPTGLSKIRSNVKKTNYLLVRRKYYTAILRNALEGAKPKPIERVKYQFLELYFRLRLKLNG